MKRGRPGWRTVRRAMSKRPSQRASASAAPRQLTRGCVRALRTTPPMNNPKPRTAVAPNAQAFESGSSPGVHRQLSVRTPSPGRLGSRAIRTAKAYSHQPGHATEAHGGGETARCNWTTRRVDDKHGASNREQDRSRQAQCRRPESPPPTGQDRSRVGPAARESDSALQSDDRAEKTANHERTMKRNPIGMVRRQRHGQRQADQPTPDAAQQRQDARHQQRQPPEPFCRK